MPATSAPDSTMMKTSATSQLPRRRVPARRVAGADFCLRVLQHAQPGPEHQAEEQEGQPEVGRQPVLRDARIVDQAALDHVPAHRALQAAEDEEAEHLGRQAPRNWPRSRNQT
jgi:hypothetical protein